MKHLNGTIEYNDIDELTNSFEINHEYGQMKSLSNTFTIENIDGKKRVFRPASVVFKNGRVKVSIGTFRVGIFDKIYYSFGFLYKEEEKRYFSSGFAAKLKILSNTVFSAKMHIIGITPGIVVINSDIPFGEMQSNKNPNFWWDEPEDNNVNIIGYHYAFNQYRHYFVNSRDYFTEQTSIQLEFPSSGLYYFHVRAINEYGSMSVNTSTVEVKYNDVPSIPLDLRINRDVIYTGSTSLNELSWEKSIDQDGDDIKYEVQIIRNGIIVEQEKTDGTIDESNISSDSSEDEDRRFYFYPKGHYSGELTQEGEYFWRVRSYDWLENSEWSDYSSFTIRNHPVAMYGKFYIPEYGIENGMFGHFFIKKNSVFYGSIYFFPQMCGKLTIANEDVSDLYGSFFVSMVSGFSGKIHVINNFSSVNGRFNIIDVYGSNKMCGLFTVLRDGSRGFRGKFTVCEYDNSSFFGQMMVYVKGQDSFCGSVHVLRKNFCGKMMVIQKGHGEMVGKMSVINRPTAPIISSNTGSDWQDNPNVDFSWHCEHSNIPVISYGYYLSHERQESPNISLFYNTPINELSVNLDDIRGAREYYLYVFARGSNLSISDISEYIVRYNNIPSIPGMPLKINNEECVFNIPIIGKDFSNVFSWEKSVDLDRRDLLSYRVEISKDINFSSLLTSYDNIIYSGAGDTVEFSIQYNFEENYNEAYFWRVKCFDGHQYSSYSFIGRFRVNNPPGVPYNLEVEDGI